MDGVGEPGDGGEAVHELAGLGFREVPGIPEAGESVADGVEAGEVGGGGEDEVVEGAILVGAGVFDEARAIGAALVQAWRQRAISADVAARSAVGKPRRASGVGMEGR